MIQEDGNIELCELLETEPNTQCKVFIMLECRENSTARSDISCMERTNQQIINYTTHLPVPEYVIKKGRPHGHRYGKKLETKSFPRLTNWRKSNRMIEMIETKMLVDWWMFLRTKIILFIWLHKNTSTVRRLHSNKQESKTVPLRNRSDFKQALSTLQFATIQQETGKEQHVFFSETLTMGGTKFIFHMTVLERFMMDSLSFRKSWRKCAKYWVNGTICCLQYLARFFGKCTLLQMDRLQVYCNGRVG